MRKLIRAVALALAMLVGSLGLATPAVQAVSDQGSPAITRLWMPTDDSGDKFLCTASYIQPYLNDSLAVVLTAGHCTDGRYIKRSIDNWISGIVRWVGVLFLYNPWLTNRHSDIAVGIVPDVREAAEKKHKLWLANETPERGHVYIHGFPAGIETIVSGRVVPPELNKEFSILVQVDQWGGLDRKALTELIQGTRVVITPHDSIKGGSSGSPLFGDDGRVVGVLWGTLNEDSKIQFRGQDVPEGSQVTLFTPIERVHDILKLLELK